MSWTLIMQCIQFGVGIDYLMIVEVHQIGETLDSNGLEHLTTAQYTEFVV